MAVYILKHPSPDFTGVQGGVDFYNGQGSTSSLQDVHEWQKRGASVVDAENRPIVVEAKIHPDAHIEILTAKVADPGPSIATKGEGVPDGAPSPSLSSHRAADVAALKAQEDNPESAFSQKRAAADKAKKAHHAEAQIMIVAKLTEDQAIQDAIFPVEVKVYKNGSQLIPSAATITARDGDGTVLVSAASMTINATTGTLTYSLAATHTADLAENMVIEVDYTVTDGAQQAVFFFDVVLQKLTPTVTDDDLKAYFPNLGKQMWTDEASYAGQIAEAFLQIKRMLKDRGKRPSMLVDGSQLRELIIVKTFELIFFNFAKGTDDIWWARHEKYRALFNERFASLVIKYDDGESGTIDTGETGGFSQPVLVR